MVINKNGQRDAGYYTQGICIKNGFEYVIRIHESNKELLIGNDKYKHDLFLERLAGCNLSGLTLICNDGHQMIYERKGWTEILIMDILSNSLDIWKNKNK